MSTETLTESLRRRLRESIDVCPTCHRPIDDEGVRKIAKRVGLSHTTLWRFLRGDGPTSSATLDVVAAYLDGDSRS